MHVKCNNNCNTWAAAAASALMLAMATPASAHFQMIVPSDDMVQSSESTTVNLDLLFWHPFEGIGMHMSKPAQFGVVANGQQTDLLNSLKQAETTDIEGNAYTSFAAQYRIKRPGDHIFYVEPQPYWEPAEEAFIVHYTKVIVNGLGMEKGWDEELGLKTEIVPLTRPYGLWTGNSFQGIVKVDGQPVPFGEVEVEYYADNAKIATPADPMITQVVKADSNGVFSYTMPKAGWWGFAALNEDDKPMSHEGQDYPVEIGAVLWVKTHDMK